MFPVKYELSKEAALEVMEKIDHSLDQLCSSPWCGCGDSIQKALIAAGEIYVRSVNQKIGRETYLLKFEGFN